MSTVAALATATMRTIVAIFTGALAALALTGCASRPTPAPQAERLPPRSTLPPAPSTVALAFAPPISVDAEELGLERDGRQTVAYAGYEQQVFSTTYTRTDDRQRWGRYGEQSSYERRSISTSVTVRGN